MKKGFTLVELLAVVIILGALALITFPIIDKSIKQSKEKALDRTIKSIIDASYEYSISNDLGYSSNYKKLEFETLINAGLLKEVMINPITDKELEGCVLYRWVDEYKQYEFEYSETCESPNLTIKDVVLSNFPYLEVGDNGCKNPSDDNYSYMGGCYLKNYDSYGAKDYFHLYSRSFLGITQEELENNFYDENGNFKLDEYEKYVRNNLFKDNSDEEVKQFFDKAGVSTFFEYVTAIIENIVYNGSEGVGTPISYEKFFEKSNNYVWYSGFLWQIMGINSDGTVRLILQEGTSGISYDDNSSTFIGSYAEEYLNTEFIKYLSNSDNVVANYNDWCQETWLDDTALPNSTCDGNTFASKIGLLTLDEYKLGGGYISYLNIGQVELTLTKYSEDKIWAIINLDNGGYLKEDINVTLSPRPIININPHVIVTGGNGSVSNNWNNEEGPFVLNEDKSTDKTGKLNENALTGEYVLFAGKKYRIVSKDDQNNTKLILDEIYQESNENFYDSYPYGESNVFSVDSGIGLKLNTEVLEWLVPSNDIENRNKLVKDYTWYQNDYSPGQHFNVLLDEIQPIRTIKATVGLIRVGEMMATFNSSFLSKGYTQDISWRDNPYMTFWTMTTNNDKIWIVSYGGSALSSIEGNLVKIRPVIVIKSDVEIIEGTGTYSNPYKI